ncbi:MAG TPA: M14 family metallopeptidase [Leptospiraceae bacterium]|nr:M14 family metallopeptidase [Leptospiraceae bacterium]
MDFFLDTYEECRAAFLQIAKQAIKVFPGSYLSHISAGKSGDVDALLIRKKKKPASKLVLISSGVHGVEGFVGSALQRKILSEMIQGSFFLPGDVLFLHGINPYGFKNCRRVNESNVDLNRNFYLKRERVPKKEKNKGYRKFVSFFKPGLRFSFYPLELLLFVSRLAFILIKYGSRQFSDAALTGQYEYKKGIYYGGKKPEPVVRNLRRFFKKTMKEYAELLVLDIHTGYGDSGKIYLFQNSPPGSSEDKNIRKISDSLPLLRPDSEGYYRTAGDFIDFPGRIFPAGKRLFPLTFEIGSCDNLRMAGVLRSSFITVAENRIYHHGALLPWTEKRIKRKFLRLFYPESEEWRKKVLRDSIYLFRTICDRFGRV